MIRDWEQELVELVRGHQYPHEANGHVPDGLTGWEPVELGPILDGTAEEVRPTIFTRDDGTSIFYEGRINGLAGESGHGKSWVALSACAETLKEGRRSVYIDLEDHPRSIVGRLVALGVERDTIGALFTYVQPQRRSGDEAITLIDTMITTNEVALVVIDSVGEAMALNGMKQNDDDAVADWYRHHARRWAALGPAVILIDHIPKSPDAPKLFAIGSQRKKAAVDGALYRVEERRPMAIGELGIIGLICAKDRHGTFANGSEVALCHFDSSPEGDRVTYQIRPGELRNEEGRVMRPTFIMEKVSRVLEQGPALTGRQVESQVRAVKKTRSQVVRDALKVLVEEGYVGAHDGPRRAVFYHSIKTFRDQADALESIIGSSESERVPSESGTQWAADEVECVRASHPLGGDALDSLAAPDRGSDKKEGSASEWDELF